MNRQFHYNEELEEQSTSSSTLTLTGELVFLPDPSSDYFIFFTCAAKNSLLNAVTDTEFYIPDSGGASILNMVTNHDVLDYYSSGGVVKYTSGASPTNSAFQAAHSRGASGGTGFMKDIRILAIKKHPADYFLESNGVVTTSTDPVEAASITLNEAGDYIVVAWGECLHDNTTTFGEVKLSHNSTDYNVFAFNPGGGVTDRRPWFAMKKITAAVNDTIKVYCRSLTANTTTIYPLNIVALRADTFDNNYYGESLGRSTTSSTTYQTQFTLTATPLAEEHFVFYNAKIDADTNINSCQVKGLQGSTDKQETRAEPWVGSGSDNYNFAIFAKESLSAASTDWKNQWRKPSGVSSAGIEDGAIAVIQDSGTGTVNILGNTTILGKTTVL